MQEKSRPLVIPIMCALVMALGGLAVYAGAYDLFAVVPQVAVPRVTIERTIWGDPMVRFVLNTPTLASAFMALGGGLAIYGALRELWRWWTRSMEGRFRFRIAQALGLGTAVLAWLLYVTDMLGTAFDGVG